MGMVIVGKLDYYAIAPKLLLLLLAALLPFIKGGLCMVVDDPRGGGGYCFTYLESITATSWALFGLGPL